MSFESKYSDNAVYLCFEQHIRGNKDIINELGFDFIYHEHYIYSTCDYKKYLRKYQIDEYDIHSASDRPHDRPIKFYESEK